MKITASSTALISSWMFLEDLGVCFDAGDGLCATLGLKSRKIKHIFVSHADRDHLAGLLQFNSLNGSTSPHIHFPADSGSFPALRDFCAAFDHHTGQSQWLPMKAGDEVEVGKGLFVRAMRSDHNAKGDLHKALSFVVVRRTKKLRQEFAGQNIADLRKTVEDTLLFETVDKPIFGYSGDGTPNSALWANVPILAHEATFVVEADAQEARAQHSSLSAVLTMMATLQPKLGILYHFSPRYRAEEITTAVTGLKTQLGITFPIEVVLPGAVSTIEIA